MAVWIVSMLINRSISKKRLKGFLEYILENIKDFDPEIEEHLFAKQKSKQVRPDIMLFIIEEKQNIILIQDSKTSGIAHQSYAYEELVDVNSMDQSLEEESCRKHIVTKRHFKCLFQMARLII